MQEFKYFFNISGDFSSKIQSMTVSTDNFTKSVKNSTKWIDEVTTKLTLFTRFSESLSRFSNNLTNMSRSGISLDQSMHELSAIAGVVGDDLTRIEDYARNAAKTFGTDAAEAVEAYKLILGQLSPEIAKQPEALAAMGNAIQTTAKLMNNDARGAAEVLTTAMNQYGVSLDDPMAASQAMANMMNVMAAAGQAGSAELPAIKVALENCGMAAKAANVSFEETNAAIQVLDKAGKKGSEGGTALRNVFSQLSEGRFTMPAAREGLEALGIDVTQLADKSLSLHDRLELLKPLLNDDALLVKYFGVYNANAARALIQNNDAMAALTAQITDTASAEEQAATVMESYAERQARINQKMEDFRISLFNLTGGAPMWVSAISECITPMLGFVETIVMGIVMLPKIKAGAILAFTGMRTAAVTACKAISVAIASIPIVGWIAIAITAIGILGAVLWKNCATFRAGLKGIWAWTKEVFRGIGEIASNVFSTLGELFSAAFRFDTDAMRSATDKLKSSFTMQGMHAAEAFREAYDKEMAEAEKTKDEGQKTADNPLDKIKATLGSDDIGTDIGHVGAFGGMTTTPENRAGNIRNVVVQVEKLVENFTVQTTQLQESTQQIKETIARALLDALNDANLAVS